MKTAKPVKVLNERQTIYELDPPYDYYGEEHKFVCASKALAWTGTPGGIPGGSFMAGFSGGNPREVLVFPADSENITSMGEIGGSYDEPDGHTSALAGMGYVIQE